MDNIGYLFLNRPPKNEMDAVFFSDLSAFVKNTMPELSLKGMIITGKKRHFSSGANVHELARLSGKKDYSYFANNINYMESISLCNFPVIAAINGICYGSAFELALACHYRIASPGALFSFPEITYNLMPGCGGTYFLPKLIGKSKAVEIILSGRPFFAPEANQLGVIDVIVDKSDILQTAAQLIERLNSANGQINENSTS
ncbi:MAG: enoyl-CoA hydratase/isomerase family protein [Calditrichaceae bacterium]